MYSTTVFTAIFWRVNTLASQCIEVVPHPPYSPNLDQNNLFLFSKAKLVVKGHNFETTQGVENTDTTIKIHHKRSGSGVF